MYDREAPYTFVITFLHVPKVYVSSCRKQKLSSLTCPTTQQLAGLPVMKFWDDFFISTQTIADNEQLWKLAIFCLCAKFILQHIVISSNVKLYYTLPQLSKLVKRKKICIHNCKWYIFQIKTIVSKTPSKFCNRNYCTKIDLTMNWNDSAWPPNLQCNAIIRRIIQQTLSRWWIW